MTPAEAHDLAVLHLLEWLKVRRVYMEPTVGRFGQMISREEFARVLAPHVRPVSDDHV